MISSPGAHPRWPAPQPAQARVLRPSAQRAARERTADGERVAHQHGQTPRDRPRIVREPELTHDRELVEVGALADQAVILEEEMRTRTAAERAPRRWERAQRSEVRPEDVDLDDDCVVGVVERDELVALVGKGSWVSAK